MDEISTKAIIIGVSIFVTLIILTVVVFEFEQIQSIYKEVGQTNISFEERLDEFDKYRDSNNIFTGLDVRNTVKKYINDDSVNVCIETTSGEVCNDSIDVDKLDYTNKYSSNLNEQSNIYKIVFTEI